MSTQAQWWSNRWRDWAMLVLAVWLFVSPWLLNFAAAQPTADTATATIGPAAWNAWIIGIVIGALSIWAISAFAEWHDWVNGLLGIWLVVAPWLLGFAAMTTAVWNHVIVGLLVLAFAAWELWAVRHGGAGATA